jgi:hypothetical protein
LRKLEGVGHGGEEMAGYKSAPQFAGSRAEVH